MNYANCWPGFLSLLNSTLESQSISLRALVWAGIFLLALVPRLILATLFYDAPIGLDDMFQYDMLARSLLSGNGYRWYQRVDVQEHRRYFSKYYGIDLPIEDVPEAGYQTTFRAPGYPFFLASIYALAEEPSRVGVARVVQAFLGASSVLLAAAIAQALGFSMRTAAWTGIAVALYPTLWIYPLGLASENIFIPLILIGTLAMLRAARKKSVGWILLAGAVLGFATLVRGALGILIPLAVIWMWKSSGRRHALYFLGPVIAVLLPWIIRNSLIWGRPTFIETTVGFNLYIGYHPEGDGGFKTSLALQPTQFIDDQERDQWSTEQALGFIADDPGRVIELSIRRFAYFWGLEDREILYFYSNNFFGPLPSSTLLVAYSAMVLPLVLITTSMCLGLALVLDKIRDWANFRPHALILAHVIASLFAYVPILAEPRFHLPLIPMLAPYAALAWTTPQVHSRLRNMKAAFKRSALAAIAVLMTVWIWEFARDFDRLQQVIGPDGNRLYLGY
jgi:4-amino-4-deoxy-L-arabinose transferase-like glycosyltransferase